MLQKAYSKKKMQNVASCPEEDKYTYKNHILKVKYCLIFPIFFISPPIFFQFQYQVNFENSEKKTQTI